ncbi:hypothetical protein G6F31_019631 [Rhizopus arrhizus]|nr:hypothetical protein G6F31_019631 [Rhizopus arrhizus]
MATACSCRCAPKSWCRQWMYDLDSPVGALTVLTPNDGRRPHDDGEAIGLDWAEGVLRVLRAPAQEEA